MANSEDRPSAPRGYPVVTVGLHEITDLRRFVSHLREMLTQLDVLLSDLGDLVGRLPDWENVDDE